MKKQQIADTRREERRTILHRRLLRTREGAAYLGVSPWTVRKLVKDGTLPIVKVFDGAAWRLDRRDLDAFIEQKKRISPLLLR